MCTTNKTQHYEDGFVSRAYRNDGLGLHGAHKEVWGQSEQLLNAIAGNRML